MNKEWDLTVRKRASKKHNIVKCPICGKYGQARIYINSTPKFAGAVNHKGHVEMGVLNIIDESCILTEKDVKGLKK